MCKGSFPFSFHFSPLSYMHKNTLSLSLLTLITAHYFVRKDAIILLFIKQRRVRWRKKDKGIRGNLYIL